MGDLTNKAELTLASGQQLTLQGNTVINRGGLGAVQGSIQLLGTQVRLLGEAQVNVGDLNIEATEKISINQAQPLNAENFNLSVIDQEGILNLRGVDIRAVNTHLEGESINLNGDILVLKNLEIRSDSLRIRESNINVLGNILIANNGGSFIQDSNLLVLGSLNADSNYFEARGSRFLFLDIGNRINDFDIDINPGDVLFSSRDNQVWDNSQILVGTLIGRGRNIQLTANTLDVLNSSSIIIGSANSSRQGDLKINADQVRIRGIEETTTPEESIPNIIGLLNFNDSASGNLEITTNRLLMTDSSLVVTSSFGSKAGGDLNIDADRIRISGLGGNPIFPSFLAAVAAGQGDSNGFPPGGDIQVNAREILLDAGGGISTTTVFSPGGQILVEADKIDINGKSDSSGASSGISSDSYGRGDSGVIIVRANSINIDNFGDISASNRRPSEIGENRDFNIDRIEKFGELFSDLNGELSDGNPSFLSFIDMDLGSSLLPDLENIFQDRIDEGQNINADELGNAGNIFLYVDDLSMSYGGEIFARTRARGNGGNIHLSIENLLLLDDSSIETTAGTDQAGGDGGDITIRADEGFIVGLRNQNGDIVANAFSGNGGNVNITAQDIFGFQVLTRNELKQRIAPGNPLDPSLLPSNDITAISQNNPQLSGTVTFQTPDLDPSRGLTELPSALLNAGDQIDTDLCQATAASSFTSIGRGGLHPAPGELLTPTDLWRDQRLIYIPESTHMEATYSSESDAPLTQAEPSLDFAEAQGWHLDANGSVHLVIDPVSHAPQDVWASPQACNARATGS